MNQSDVSRERVGEDVERRGERAVRAEAALEDRRERVDEEERQERERDAVGRARASSRRSANARCPSTRSIQRSRFASISVGGSSSGLCRHDRVLLELRRELRRPRSTGKTNILSGTSSWKRFESMKSTSLRAPSSFRAPRSTPANSICRKQVSSTTAVGAAVGRGVAEDHLGGRARRVRDDDRPVALAPAEPEKRTLYASSQPSTTSTSFVAQLPPVVLPAVLAEARDRREQEREPRGRGRRVLDDEEAVVARLGQVVERAAAASIPRSANHALS